MNKLIRKISLALLTLLISSNLFALERARLESNGLVNLDVDSDTLLIEIHYPTHISNICGLKIATNIDLFRHEQWEFSQKITVKQGDYKNSPTLEPRMRQNYRAALTYQLEDILYYVTWVEVKTKSGATLSQVLSEHLSEKGSDSLIGFVSTPCKSNM
jgi:hypothetical protein